MIKSNFIVITGGPGSGKSTILKALYKLGYKYVDETGRKIIKTRIDKGLPPRPGPEEFARQMFDLDYRNYLDNIEVSEPLFFDRSFLDSASLLVKSSNGDEPSLTEILTAYRFNKEVFITPPWKEIYCNDNERDQTYEESVITYESLYHWYQFNGYTLLSIPRLPVESRVQYIQENIKL